MFPSFANINGGKIPNRTKKGHKIVNLAIARSLTHAHQKEQPTSTRN